MKKRLNKKGFTLIELIIVVAIVALLVTIGVPTIAGHVARSQLATATVNAKSVASQAEIMITQLEVAGATVTKPSDSAVISGCGIADKGVANKNDVESIIYSGSEATGWKVDRVVVYVGGQKGIFTRV